jgi:hypothetical protein
MSDRSLGAFIKCLVRRCDTRGSLFHGSIVDARGYESYLYSCQKCGRVFSSTESTFVKKFNGIRLIKFTDYRVRIEFYSSSEDGLLSIKESVEDFIDSIKKGDVYFSRDDLGKVLLSLQNLLSTSQRQFSEAFATNLSLSENLLEKEQIISGLLTTPVFVPDLIMSDIDKDNERQINNSHMLSTWLITLLNHGTVSVPIEAYRLFHLLLSVNYGYEVMRYRWEWNTVVENGEKRMVFQNRTKRRTNRTKR